ncbi:MAG TPA: maleylpyruvate isomerase family mycothiol-dependent enzyme, partial [Sphingobacteriaceae bacterium]
LLRGLNQEQWQKPTVCKRWTVKDIAAHLLDTSLRRLSSGRDGYKAPFPQVHSYGELVQHLNSLNAIWVDAYSRVSPAILIEQIQSAQEQQFQYLSTLDPAGEALFPVSWAGEELSANWFDIAREYTERWLHQQQIRQAVGAEGLLAPELYSPFLNTIMLALPHTFNTHQADALTGSTVKVDVIGQSAGSWMIEKGADTWFFTTSHSDPDSQVYVDEQIAWLLFTRGIDVMEARQFWQVLGDQELGSTALKMVSVMAYYGIGTT